MDNDYKTKFVEPQQSVAVADVEQPPDDELAAKALEEIHNTERLSGFGRFQAADARFRPAGGPVDLKSRNGR